MAEWDSLQWNIDSSKAEIVPASWSACAVTWGWVSLVCWESCARGAAMRKRSAFLPGLMASGFGPSVCPLGHLSSVSVLSLPHAHMVEA